MPLTRRELLQTGGAALAGGLLSARPETARGYYANDMIQVGCIGTGGRCRKLMSELVNVPGTRMVAVCDVWDAARAEGLKVAGAGATETIEFERVLDRKDIDAVLIGSPDHWHVPMTVAACQAGKDVYIEKPLTHSLSEGAAVIDAQNRHQRIVQVGTQQRSMTHLVEAQKILKSGALGPIHKVHLSWNRNTPRWKKTTQGIDPKSVDWKRFLGNAPDQPFDEYRFRQWRWFWDFGGGIFTDLMVHWIDVVHWMLELDHDHPALAASIGDNFKTQGVWETPDTVQTLLEYPQKQLQAHFEGTFCSARNGAMCEFMGEEATLYVDRGRYEIHPERHSAVKASELVLGTGPRGADFYDQPNGELLHLTNWIDCCRSRKKPNAPAEAGVSSAAAAHLANRAFRDGQIARWQG
jgi:predicted dehydrogenase